MKKSIFVTIACLFLVFSTNCKQVLKKNKQAINGVLDLRQTNSEEKWDFVKDGVTKLDGDWEFYWKELYTSNDFIQKNISSKEFINIPSVWNGKKIGNEILPGEGYATYRLKLLLPPDQKDFYLKVIDFGTSYNLYFNGKLIANNGKSGKTKEESEPNLKPMVVPIPDLYEENEIIIQVSNFVYARGGFWFSIQVGRREDIQKVRDDSIFVDLFLAGSLFIMGMYHFGLFSTRRKDRFTLYFGLFCILVFFRIIATGERFILHLFPELPFELLIRIEYLTFYMGTPIFAIYVRKLFPAEYHKKFFIATILFSIPLCILVLFSPIKIFTATIDIIYIYIVIMSFAFIYIFIKAAINNRMGGKIFLFTFVLFFLTIINDILHARNAISTAFVSAYGFFIFIFSQAFLLSVRFSTAFTNAKVLSDNLTVSNFELKELKQNLEIKVIERTLELEESKKNMEEQKKETETLNHLIKSLNENVDLKVIMQKIHNYIETNYGIKYYGIGIVDSSNNSVHTIDAVMPDFISEDDREIVKNFSTKIKDVIGAHAFAFKAKKVFYKRKVVKHRLTSEETTLLNLLGLESFLIIPLILQNEPIGFLDLYNTDKMDLTKEDIIHFSILGEQLAGIIYSSSLFKQIQEARENMEIAKEEAESEKIKAEIALDEMEQISTITRKLNELTDIDQVLEEIFDYFFYTYGLSFAAFQLIDRAKEEIVPYKMSQFADPEKHTLFQTFNVKISSSSGSMCKAYDTKKPVFIKDANSAIQTSEIDRIIVEQFKINSYIQVPLLIQKEVFGIMMIGIYLELSNSSYDALKRFCNQITVAIYNTFLLKEANQEKEKSDLLLLNILPRKIADELKLHGQVEPTFYESMSVMFTDFEKFTQIAEKLTPHELVKELDTCFTQFDKISGKFKLEKLKTIGDSFMCAGGIPNINNTHAIDCSLAALEILSFMNDMRSINESLQKAYWEIRIGIHSGPVMAGVVGERKFAYDIWGDTVNTASRMESSGTSGKINISHSSYELIKEYFECEYRGEIKAKNKGMIKMFYLNRIKKEFSKDENGFVPNEIFWDKYNAKNYNKSIDVALLD